MPIGTNDPAPEVPIPPPAEVPDAPPPDNGPGDTEAKPSSIFAGIGDCVVDELVGLWELVKFLYELKEDFDIASDGVDNYFSSFFYDAYQTTDLFVDLSNGSQVIGDLPNEQQLALQRLWAKQAMIRQELEKAMDHGIDVIAALDLYVIDTENEQYIPIVPRYALKAITAGMALLYEPDEWLMRAARGKAFVDQMIATIKAEIEARPWYVAGYVMCIIATMIIPITKVTAAIKALRPVLAILDAAPSGRAIRAALRNKGLNLPEHLGGSRTPDVDTTPDVDADTPDPVVTDVDRPRSETDIDNDAQQTTPPEEPETPETTPNTTNVPRTARIGNMAEADARARLDREGYNTFELKNGSGHGPDIIAVHRDTGAVRVIEVKANSSTLNPLQKQGGPAYLQNVLGRARNPRQTTWNTAEFDRFLRRNGKTEADLANGNFEIWRYKSVDPDNPDSVAGGPSSTPWTQGTTGREFRLDANGNIQRRVNRIWTEYVEPDEYSN